MMNSMDLGVKKLTIFFLCLNVFIIALVPTGGFPSFKALVLLGSITLVAYAIATRVIIIRFSWQKLIVTLLFPVLIFMTIEISFVHRIDSDGILLEARSIFTIYILVIVYYLVIKEKLITYEVFLKYFFLGHVLYICIKVFILFYFFSLGDKTSAVLFLSGISSNIVVAGKLGVGGAYRIVSGIDLVSPFLFFIVLISNINMRKSIKILLLSILFINVIITLSRYGMVSFVILFFLYCLCMRKMIVFLLLSLFTVGSIIVAADVSNINLYGAIEHRFNGEGKLSTAVKVEQSYYLLREIAEFPLLGKGLGSYVEDYLRSSNPKYGYEAFWLALWMQLGTLGMIVFMFYLWLPVFLALKKTNKNNIMVSSTYILFLGGGMTNPTVIGISASIMYVLMFVVHLQSTQPLWNKSHRLALPMYRRLKSSKPIHCQTACKSQKL